MDGRRTEAPNQPMPTADVDAGSRPSRHFLAFVQHARLSSWIVRAVEPTIGHHLDDELRRTWAGRARAAHRRLRGDGPDRIWPWAYAAGPTPAARSVRAGDVLWVFGRMRALGRDWPPSLVARMQIAETHPGPRGWEEWKRHAGDGTRPGFPFADAHRFYASATGSRFYPYGNAVPALLALGYGGGRAPTELLTSADDDVLTIDGARRAWRRASLTEEGVTRFRSLRRIHDTSIGHLDGFAASIDVHSAFVSYRWAEGRGERSDAARADERLADLAERLVEDGLAIWLDRLLLPPSPLQRRRGDPVLSRILADGITRARLLVAVVTARYGGPSRRDAPGARSAVRRGYTALEWAGAADVPRVRWDLEPCEFEHELSGRADVRLTARHAAGDVARTARQLLV